MKFRNYLGTASVYYRHYDSHLAGTLSDPRKKKKTVVDIWAQVWLHPIVNTC